MGTDTTRRAKIIVDATHVHALLGLHPDLRIDGMVSSPGSDQVSIFVTSPHRARSSSNSSTS